MHNIGTQKQLFIDERFIADKRDVALTVNPPAKAGAIDVEASTAPSIVEHDGTCYLYQGLNGATSVWTSADGLDWETLIKCDLIHAVRRSDLRNRRGAVSPARRRQIVQRMIECNGWNRL